MKQYSFVLLFSFFSIGNTQAMDTSRDSSQTYTDPLKALLGDYSFMSVAHIQTRTDDAPITLPSGKVVESSAPFVMIITQVAKTE